MYALLLVMSVLGLLVPFEKDGRWGYREPGGKVVIPPRYQMAREFSPEGLAAVVDEQGWAYIGAAGQIVIRPVAVDNGPDYFREGLARFTRAGKTGFFDRQGKVVIEPAYTWAMPFSEGRAAVCDGCKDVEEGEHHAVKGGRWGFIDRTGRLVIPLRFEEVRAFAKGRARVRAGGRWREIVPDGAFAPGESRR